MNEALRHRGPDDEGLLFDPAAAVALGARRLSIIDVAGGHQPVTSEDGRVWATLNGEIYNYRELRERLERRGHRFRSRVDTEVLVHLYEEYGDRLVHALEGMYALAIWDGRRQRLLLARDRFGEKPLFYADGPGGLAFASELTALLAGARLRAAPDPSAVDEFFLFGYVLGPGTIVGGVSQLPPGGLLRWTRRSGAGAPWRYWDPPRPLERLDAPRELIQEVGELLAGAVRSRMVSDVPLGVFLSGGVDSTLIAALAARQHAAPVKTFTVGYTSGTVSETAAARAAARAIGTDHHEHIVTDADARELVPELLSRLDQPLADRALVAMHSLARFTREHVKTVIGGEGADELFGGYGRYRWLTRAEHVPRRISGGAGRVAEPALRRLGLPRADHVADLVGPWAPGLRNLNWVTERRLGLRGSIYGDRLRPSPAARWIDREWDGDGPVAAAAMALDLRRWLPDDVLAKADRAGMLASLEVRTPYLQRELAELAALVPPHLHLAGGGKALLRRLLAEVLPGGPPRPKTAFRVPAAQWLRGPLAGIVDAQLAAGTAYADGWLSREATERLWREHRTGRRDWTALLWPALAFGLWLDRAVP
jgi:asparagine synthase (glutamine-hydrolysing)